MKLLLKRIIAHIIDGIILGIIGVFWVALLISLKRTNLLSVEVVKILYTIGFIIIGVLYFLQEGPLGKGQTIGKKALKIKVISLDEGVPSYKQAIIRNLLRVWDGIFFYAMGISRISRSEKGQRFGDKVAKTIVVEDSRGLPKIWILIILALVVAAGVLVWRQFKVPAEVEQPSANETANLPAEDSAAEDWKTYRNEEYGFEVRYPNDWQELNYSWAKEKGLVFAGFSNDGTETNMGDGQMKQRWSMVTITKIEWKQNKDIRDFFQDVAAEDQPSYSEMMLVDGVESIKGLGVRNSDIVVFIPRGGYLYQVDLLTTDFEYSEVIFNQMLSFFRFFE